MSRAFPHLRTGLFAAGVAAALGFGATQAFAKNIECWDPELYTCSSHAHCAWICNELGDPNG
ncbi:MAG TPA: hypothetical protein VHG28_17500, partial [Longimicrobiaceae bacterium]|nr:hypothetical protein [Longimicrobiaceae bacterium]